MQNRSLIYSYWLVTFIFISTFSCDTKRQKIERIVEGKFSEKINLIDSLGIFSAETGWTDGGNANMESKFAVVTYIDGTCNSCIYELEQWQQYMEESKDKNVIFLFYVNTMNIRQMESLLKDLSFNHPVFIDYKNTFYTANKLNSNKLYQTFLINGNREILLVGNPIYSIDVRNLYDKVISESI
jgi:hypothetical protein